MTFSLKPNPSLYAKLAAQWEAEEARRQTEAAARSYFVSRRNAYLILFIVAIFLIQSSLLLYRILVKSHTKWVAQPTSFDPNMAVDAADFHLPRPANDSEVQRMFVDLMHKCGWNNLPEAATRQMLAYSPTKKWTIVHYYQLCEWQARRQPYVQRGKDVEDVVVLSWAEGEKSFTT